MDFFEAQERAKRRTSRLVVLFVLAVAGTIVAGYFTTILLLTHLANRSPAYSSDGYARFVPWQPDVLGWVALGTIAVVGLSSLRKWSALRGGGTVVAELLGGRRLAAGTTDLKERQLLNVVEEMAIASGVPLPAVYVLDQEQSINAFAAGLTTSDAVVAVTRGTLQRLSRDELQGVVAHEFSHILNGDMRLNLKLTSIVFGILAIALMGRLLLHSLRFARVGGGRGRKGNTGGLLLALFAIGVALLIIGYIGYFFGRLIQAAVSRQREYLADASAVQFTRHPGGIAGALKKIGGLALGARLATPAAAQFHHAFFAQAFSSFTGLFATHPPLAARIRAIEPQFDGKFVDPPTTVDVARESFRTAGFGPAQAARLRQEPPAIPAADRSPAAAVRSVGLPTPAHVEHARRLLDGLPTPFLDAARDAARAPALVYAMLVDTDPTIRAQQLDRVARGDPAGAAALAELLPALTGLPVEARLPLLQLAIGVLRDFAPEQLERFLGTLDELVHADARVTPFEYALQKMVAHHLHLAQQPAAAGQQIFSFAAVADDLAVVLSVLAFAAADSDAAAARSFAAGTAQLRMLERPLVLAAREACSLDALDAALERLTRASLPIKKRLIDAAAHVAGADGQLHPAESELLRAMSAALDCPMPPMV